VAADGRLLASSASSVPTTDRSATSPSRQDIFADLRLNVGLLAALPGATIEAAAESAGRSDSTMSGSGSLSAFVKVPFGQLADSQGKLHVDLTATTDWSDMGQVEIRDMGNVSGGQSQSSGLPEGGLRGTIWIDEGTDVDEDRAGEVHSRSQNRRNPARSGPDEM